MLDSNALELLDYDDVLVARCHELPPISIHARNAHNVILFMLEGSKILYINGSPYTINENEALFVESGNYNIKDADKNATKSCMLCFSNMFLLEFVLKHRYLLDKLVGKLPEERFLKLYMDVFLTEQLESLSVYFNNKNLLNTNAYREVVRLKIEALFLLLINRGDDMFAKFCRRILHTIPFDIKTMLLKQQGDFANVREMADLFEMNASIFSKKFKQSFGISPKGWLDNKKFEKAKLFVEFGDKNINEICKILGFHSVAWFIGRFREKYGITPKQLQKINHANARKKQKSK